MTGLLIPANSAKINDKRILKNLSKPVEISSMIGLIK